jgi:hypothetical protein
MICSAGVASAALGANWVPPYSTQLVLEIPSPPEKTAPRTCQAPPSSHALTFDQAANSARDTVGAVGAAVGAAAGAGGAGGGGGLDAIAAGEGLGKMPFG